MKREGEPESDSGDEGEVEQPLGSAALVTDVHQQAQPG